LRERQSALELAIDNAVRLHGHLGPFLVLGVRMGKLAKERLNSDKMECGNLTATVRTPLSTPYSCVLDGIQTTTNCTVGNQRLRMENSQDEISGCFKTAALTWALRISVNPEVIKEVREKMIKGASNEDLASLIASMSEERLFTIERK
jgi:formylmethanofuran dehydrogenase subunit E